MINTLKNLVILTAVDREYEKMRERLSNFVREDIDGGNRYEIFQESIGSHKVNVIIGMTGQGNSEASARTTHAIKQYDPILVVFVGTCGFIKDAQIGDIVVVTRAYDFLRGKDTDLGFNAKPVGKEITSIFRSYCQSLSQKINRGELQSEIFAGTSIHLGPVASSSVIVAGDHTQTKELIRRNYHDAIAVEMEGFGFHTAVYENNYHNAVVIRGVTDDAANKDNLSDRDIQPKVMEKACVFVMEFVNLFFDQEISKKNTNSETIVENIFVKKHHSKKKATPRKTSNHVKNLEDFFLKEYNSRNINQLLNSRNNVFCGFFSFEIKPIEEKMHLGKCYFIKLIDELLLSHKKVFLFICTTSKLFEDMDNSKFHTYINVLKDTKERWTNCFNKRIQIIDIRKYLSDNPVREDAFSRKFNEYYVEIFSNIQKLGDAYIYGEMSNALKNWRETGFLSNDYYEKIEECLCVNPRVVTDRNEMISAMYLLVIKPGWYEKDWFFAILQFLNRNIQDIIANKGIRSNMVLIESMRSSYVWDAVSFFLKKMEYPHINRLYFRTILDLRLKEFMRTSKPDMAIFIRDFEKSIDNVDPAFLSEILDLFKQETIDDLKILISKYKKRLNIL